MKCLHGVLNDLTERIFWCQKSYGNNTRFKNFWTQKKKFSYRFGVNKASKSKFASVRLKTYLNEKKQNLQFLWVNTVMGLERFVVHFLTFFFDRSESLTKLAKKSRMHHMMTSIWEYLLRFSRKDVGRIFWC